MGLNGLLLVNKEPGPTSHDVVANVRKLLKIKEVGHCGTLDPIASGLLVLTCGEATKLSAYLTDGDKKYWVRMQLGVKTDTFDVTGKVLDESPAAVNEDLILQNLKDMQGELLLDVPIYSAIKKQGKKLYEYARAGETVEVPKKVMRFWGIEIKNFDLPIVEFEVSCSKGSYIRSLVHEVGNRLGCGAAMVALERVSSFPFSLDRAVRLRDLNLESNFEQQEAYIQIENALPNLKAISVDLGEEKLLKNGQIGSYLRARLIQSFKPSAQENLQVFSKTSKQLLAIVGWELEKGFFIRRVFNY